MKVRSKRTGEILDLPLADAIGFVKDGSHELAEPCPLCSHNPKPAAVETAASQTRREGRERLKGSARG